MQVLTTDIYLAAFVNFNGGTCETKWDENGEKCRFLLSGTGLSEVLNSYETDRINVNARQFVIEYKRLAKKLKDTRPVNT